MIAQDVPISSEADCPGHPIDTGRKRQNHPQTKAKLGVFSQQPHTSLYLCLNHPVNRRIRPSYNFHWTASCRFAVRSSQDASSCRGCTELRSPLSFIPVAQNLVPATHCNRLVKRTRSQSQRREELVSLGSISSWVRLSLSCSSPFCTKLSLHLRPMNCLSSACSSCSSL